MNDFLKPYTETEVYKICFNTSVDKKVQQSIFEIDAYGFELCDNEIIIVVSFLLWNQLDIKTKIFLKFFIDESKTDFAWCPVSALEFYFSIPKLNTENILIQAHKYERIYQVWKKPSENSSSLRIIENRTLNEESKYLSNWSHEIKIANKGEGEEKIFESTSYTDCQNHIRKIREEEQKELDKKIREELALRVKSGESLFVVWELTDDWNEDYVYEYVVCKINIRGIPEFHYDERRYSRHKQIFGPSTIEECEKVCNQERIENRKAIRSSWEDNNYLSDCERDGEYYKGD